MKTFLLTSILAVTMVGAAPNKNLEQKPDRPEVNVAKPKFPRHWGHPPRIQVRDHVKLPGKFGEGSSTLAKWIADNLKRDAERKDPGNKEPKPEPKPGRPKPKPPVKPTPPIVPLPPTEVKIKMDTYKETQQDLQSRLNEKIKELGKKPTKEEVRKVVEKFRTENKDVIESQKEIGKDIHEWKKNNRPERAKRPEPTVEVKEKIAVVMEKEKEMKDIRKAFHETLKSSKDLTKDAREELIKNFKEANAEKHQALKEAQKELQKKIRETKQDGDRRK